MGAVDKCNLIDGSTIRPGDVVLGLASSGAHSNGYSLIRKVIEIAKPNLEGDFHGRKLKDVIMEPTRIYVKSLLALMEKRAGLVKGMAHITGGGLLENVPRVLADNLTAVLKKDAWEMPYLFQWLQHAGNVDAQEMYRVFNCGVGMVVIVAAEDAEMAAAQLRSTGETVYNLGTIEARAEGQAQTVVV